MLTTDPNDQNYCHVYVFLMCKVTGASSKILILIWLTVCVLVSFPIIFSNKPNPKEQDPHLPKCEIKTMICWYWRSVKSPKREVLLLQTEEKHHWSSKPPSIICCTGYYPLNTLILPTKRSGPRFIDSYITSEGRDQQFLKLSMWVL